MFVEPRPERAADKVTLRSTGCIDPERSCHAPQEELDLALSCNPNTRTFGNWIDPELAALYVISNDANDLCKIGYASNLRKRMKVIQAHCPIPVFLTHFIYVVGPLVAKRVEAEVHDLLSEERQHGEWFRVHPTKAAVFIYRVISENGWLWWDEKGRRELGYDAAKVHKNDWTRYGRKADIDAL